MIAPTLNSRRRYATKKMSLLCKNLGNDKDFSSPYIIEFPRKLKNFVTQQHSGAGELSRAQFHSACPSTNFSMNRHARNRNIGASQTFGLGLKLDLSRLSSLRADDDQAQSVICVSLLRLERLMAGGVAVVYGDDFRRAGDFKPESVLGARDEHAGFIGDGHGDERQILAIGLECGSVGFEHDFGRRAGRLDDIFGPFPAAFVRDDFQLSRFVNHVVPAKTVFKPPLLFPPERFAIQEQL